jgi:hypothetical protein
MAYVYRHIRLDKNEPFYIGIGSDNDYKRAYSTNSRNKYWQNITNKYPYEVDILLDNISTVDAKLKEIEFIKLYKRRLDGGTLCNITLGGEGANGLIRTKENKDKLSKFFMGKKRPKEVGEKISLKLKGRKLNSDRVELIRNRMIGNSYTTGIPLTQDHKNKISIANKGNSKQIVECPYCNITGGLPALKRWHFENCKNK